MILTSKSISIGFSLHKRAFLALAIFVFIFSAALLPDNFIFAATTCDSSLDGKTDAELEQILAQCEAEIAKQRELVASKQSEAKTIQTGISTLSSEISKALAEIQARNIKILKIRDDISSKDREIGTLEERMEDIEDSIGELLRQTREFEVSPVEVFLSNKNLSEFFEDADRFDTLKQDLFARLGELKGVKVETEERKIQLVEKQREEQGLRLAREAEKRKAEAFREEKKGLLARTKEEEAAYRAEIAQKEKIKQQIQNRLFRTVGGTEMTFGEAVKLVQPYEERLGVSTALILAVLTQESAINGVIGSNIGRCTYNRSWTNTSGTVMSDSQKPSFLAILKELGMDPETTPVSCPIPVDGQYGGAMGAAQFMPRTWWDIDTDTGYKKAVARFLGVSTPSPFTNLHAFMGTGLYLADASARCAPHYSGTQLDSCVAAKYYSGLGSSGTRLATHMRGYGASVAKRAAAFQDDINRLNATY